MTKRGKTPKPNNEPTVDNSNHHGGPPSSEPDDDSLPVFTTNAPCQYHRGHALHIWGLSLSHDHRVLCHAADVGLPHGSITGLVGTNGCGKSSFAQVLAARVLEGFPTEQMSVEYLAAGDDDDFRILADASNQLDDDELASWSMRPRAYIQSRMQARIDRLRQGIQDLEQSLEQHGGGDEEQLNAIAEQLAEWYELEETMTEAMERDTDHAMDQVGLQPYASKTLQQLSCGWRYKCRLIAALLTRAELIIIDEPSFLDALATEWFKGRLQHSAKSDNAIVVLISHKEMLLEDLCDRMLHINSANQTLTTYTCGYSAFRMALEADISHAQRTIEDTHDKMQAADKSLQQVQSALKRREGNFHAVVQQGEDKRWIRGKNKEAKQKADRSAASKLKKAQHAVVEAQEQQHKAKRERVKPLVMEGLPSAEGTILSLQLVGVKYNDEEDWVFQNVDTSLDATDRVLLQGANGSGKSTLVKLILGQLEPTEGSIHRSLTNILYFPQTALHQLLRHFGNKTAMEFLATANTSITEADARNHLGSLGLAKNLAWNHVKTLSAGQRVRLWLARELLQHRKPALLILDEMSENVDVETHKSLVELLDHFAAAVLVISHDADFCESFKYTKTWKLWRHGMEVSYPE